MAAHPRLQLIASPLHQLTSSKKKFIWNPGAQASFSTLKEHFSSALILTLPDSRKQFIVEVDASDLGMGAVLSKRADEHNRVHPCAFFSRRLLLAERNYDVDDRELLAVKLALEEWCHWLKGLEHPFIVWTDH